MTELNTVKNIDNKEDELFLIALAVAIIKKGKKNNGESILDLKLKLTCAELELNTLNNINSKRRRKNYPKNTVISQVTKTITKNFKTALTDKLFFINYIKNLENQFTFENQEGRGVIINAAIDKLNIILVEDLFKNSFVIGSENLNTPSISPVTELEYLNMIKNAEEILSICLSYESSSLLTDTNKNELIVSLSKLLVKLTNFFYIFEEITKQNINAKNTKLTKLCKSNESKEEKKWWLKEKGNICDTYMQFSKSLKILIINLLNASVQLKLQFFKEMCVKLTPLFENENFSEVQEFRVAEADLTKIDDVGQIFNVNGFIWNMEILKESLSVNNEKEYTAMGV
ncbi:hypothetical protein HDU92_007985 [Lobulomyces angularis]|nr:hypothetical protein HDU92_007985 [Lobulomyces angularis]